MALGATDLGLFVTMGLILSHDPIHMTVSWCQSVVLGYDSRTDHERSSGLWDHNLYECSTTSGAHLPSVVKN